MNTDPDGFIGSIMAVEGIPDATVVLHGQRGCRKGLLQSESCLLRPDRDRLVDVPYYAGNRTVPYSCMTTNDFNGTSSGRLADAMRYVSGEDYSLRVLLCSPSVSVVADDLSGYSDDNTLVVDRDCLEGDCHHGFDTMIRMILEHLVPDDADIVPGTVNLIGLSIMHKDWRTVRQEITRFLRDAGLEVVSAPGAGSNVDELRASGVAEYCVVMTPEYCPETSEFYGLHGSKIITTGRSPVGFDAVLELYRAIERETGRGLDHGIRMLNMNRRRAYESILASGTDLIGTTFRVEATPSIADTLSEWLETSVGMVVTEGVPDVLFASGDRARIAELTGGCRKGVDIGFPSSRGIDISAAPVLGASGAMYILDRLFNRLSC